jgi:hypothetical protein
MKFVLYFMLAVGVGATARAVDPWLRLARVTPASEQWRTDDPFIIGVTVALRDSAGAPRNVIFDTKNDEFGRALSVELHGPDGKLLAAEWSGGARGQWGPVTLESLQQRTYFFELDENARRRLALAPGRYTVRARLSVETGAGWRGRIEAAALPVNVVTQPPPELRLSVPAGGEIAPGDPLLLALTFAATEQFTARDRFGVPNFSGEQLPPNVTLVVRDGAGQLLAWPFEPVPPDESSVVHNLATGAQSAPGWGAQSGPRWVRLPGPATSTLAAGEYTVEARLALPYGNTVATAPLSVRVLAAERLGSATQRATSVALGLADVRLQRQQVQRVRSFLSYQEVRFAAAAATLMRIRPLATALATESPSARASLLLAEVELAGGDRARAAAVLAAMPPQPADEPRLAVALAELQARLAAVETDTDRYFLPHWRAALAAATGGGAAGTKVTPGQPSAPARGPDGQRTGQDVQWASGVRASSAYQLAGDYSAERAIGPPTVTRAGDSVQAWCSKTADAGEEWLELDFDPPVLAKAVRVVQNWNPGAVTQIEVVDADGATTIVWRGPDATVYAANQIGVLEAPFAAPSPRVVRVKVTFDTKQVKGWNEIDAVGLVPVR